METIGRRPFLAAAIGGLPHLPLLAQQAAVQPYKPKQSDRPEAITGDEPAFKSIFDGRTLDGWEGNPKYWRVEDGVMVGEITPETIIKSNTFLIWRGGSPKMIVMDDSSRCWGPTKCCRAAIPSAEAIWIRPRRRHALAMLKPAKDFELKVDFRITSGGNSGINYRSVVVPDTVTPENKFAMRGYQCDIDGKNLYTGNNYEEKGRLFLAVRGQVTHVVGTRKPIVVSSLGDNADLGKLITTDWNSAHVIARGNIAAHTINGRLMSMVIDDDVPNRTMEGLIGVQVHVGGPMKIEYRTWRLKNL